MNSTNRSLAKKHAKNDKVSYEEVTAFQGPLPSPDVLAGFEKVLSGSAERIIQMAEKEQAHRHQEESKISTASVITMVLGVIFALLVSTAVCFLIYYSIFQHESGVAVALATTSLVGVIGAFLWFKKAKHQ